jgi:NaMN:DMB phosphoribosyltransferase
MLSVDCMSAGMTLANMGLTLGLIPFAAHLADKGLPKLAAAMGVLVIAAVCSIPMLLAVSTQSMVAAWLMQVIPGITSGW